MNPRTGAVRVLRHCPYREDAEPDCHVHQPRYAPDGRRIAFATLTSSYPLGPAFFRWGLGLMASDGTRMEERATDRSNTRVAWSPTGKRLLIERYLDGFYSPRAIYLASLDGTELRQVTPGGTEATDGTGAPDWASTGEIAFVRYGSTCEHVCSNIFVTRLGGAPRRLTYRGGDNPSWSPRATRLAFDRHRSAPETHGVYVVRRDGSGLRRLTRTGHDPAWSPDGRWIAFIRAGDLFVVRSRGGAPRRVVDESWYEIEGTQVTSIDWQPLPRR